MRGHQPLVSSDQRTQPKIKSLQPTDVTETFFYMLVDLEGLGSVQRVDEHKEEDGAVKYLRCLRLGANGRRLRNKG